jgi:putative ABC transport system substrate-binding protein
MVNSRKLTLPSAPERRTAPSARAILAEWGSLARDGQMRIRRREFTTLLCGAAVWPLAASGQQRERMRRIGVLSNLASDDQEGQTRNATFLQALQGFGWTVGRNVRIDYRWGVGDPEFYRRLAAELVALGPDVILTNGTSTVGPVLQTTLTVPIVFVNVTDPVAGGFVESLARPGGNATGFSSIEYGMRGNGFNF